MILAVIACVLLAAGSLGFAALIWHKRKQLDAEVEHQNAQLLQEQEGIHKRNSELLQNQAKILQESVQLEESIKIKQITENELNDAIEKLKDCRNQQIVVFEREEAKLEIINNQQADAMKRLKATEEALFEKQAAEEALLRMAFEKYAENLDLEAANLDREYDELEKKLKWVYEQQQDLLEKQKEDIEKDHAALNQKLEKEHDELALKLKATYAALEEDLKKELDETRKELDKIRATKTAALEAQLREQEIKDKATFYTLQLDEADKTDISYLRSIEHNLREARPLRMLIWTTFYRDKANELASRLGANNACGIYKITHIDSGISYIGQAKNIKDRWVEHIKCSLGIDTPVTSQLYTFTRAKGIENFTFEILEQCSAAELNEKEKTYIDMYQTYEFGLNKTRGNK